MPWTLAGTECELLIMRYGMKLPAEEVSARLEECRGLLAEKHGAPFSRKCWQGKVLDFGTQSLLSMKPILVFPRNTLHEVPWVNQKSVQGYSSFGKLGGGFGGVQPLVHQVDPVKK